MVRKLVLRGYNVRVLARNKAQVVGILPSSVGIIEADVASSESLRAAVEGVDKASSMHPASCIETIHLDSASLRHSHLAYLHVMLCTHGSSTEDISDLTGAGSAM